MLLQRLVADKTIGFNYDYMGSSEFENGSTFRGRKALAELHLDSKLVAAKVRLFERWGRIVRGPIDVVVFSDTATILDLVKEPVHESVLPDLILTADQEAARIDDPKYLGWMHVNTYERADFRPLLVVRADKDNLDRGEKFLQHFMEKIQEEREEQEKKVVAPPKRYDKRVMADQSYGNRRINSVELSKNYLRYRDVEFGPDDPNPNNSDGLSDNVLRERTIRECDEGH